MFLKILLTKFNFVVRHVKIDKSVFGFLKVQKMYPDTSYFRTHGCTCHWKIQPKWLHTYTTFLYYLLLWKLRKVSLLPRLVHLFDIWYIISYSKRHVPVSYAKTIERINQFSLLYISLLTFKLVLILLDTFEYF